MISAFNAYLLILTFLTPLSASTSVSNKHGTKIALDDAPRTIMRRGSPLHPNEQMLESEIARHWGVFHAKSLDRHVKSKQEFHDEVMREARTHRLVHDRPGDALLRDWTRRITNDEKTSLSDHIATTLLSYCWKAFPQEMTVAHLHGVFDHQIQTVKQNERRLGAMILKGDRDILHRLDWYKW